MNTTLLTIIALAFAPGLFWLYYFFKKDTYEPEPLHLIRLSFFLGMLAVVPAGFLEMQLMWDNFALSIIGAPVIEELCKFSIVYFFIYRRTEFSEPMDGIIYAASVALGFASLENVFYLLESSKDNSLTLVAVTRAFLSVPGHALFSIMWGFALGVSKFHPEHNRTKIWLGLGAGIGFHAVFNFLAGLGPLWIFGMLVLIPIMWQAIDDRIMSALMLSPFKNNDEVCYDDKKPTCRKTTSAWYDNRFLVVLLLFLIFPIGFYGLWRNTSFAFPVKLTYCVLWLITVGVFSPVIR